MLAKQVSSNESYRVVTTITNTLSGMGGHIDGLCVWVAKGEELGCSIGGGRSPHQILSLSGIGAPFHGQGGSGVVCKCGGALTWISSFYSFGQGPYLYQSILVRIG